MKYVDPPDIDEYLCKTCEHADTTEVNEFSGEWFYFCDKGIFMTKKTCKKYEEKINEHK